MFKPIRTAADLPPIGTPSGQQLKFQDPDLLIDDDGLVVGTRQVPVPPPRSILQRLDDLEKAFEGFEFHLAEMDPPPLLAQTLPAPGTVYTRAQCEHCGRFSTVDVGAKLSACLTAFRDARELAVGLRESGLLGTDAGLTAIVEALFRPNSGDPEPT